MKGLFGKFSTTEYKLIISTKSIYWLFIIYNYNDESIVINQEELLQACKNYVGKFDDNIRVKHPIIIEGHINGSNCLKEIILPDSFHKSTSEVIYIRLEDMEKAFKSANSSILLCEKKIDGIQVLVVNQDCED